MTSLAAVAGRIAGGADASAIEDAINPLGLLQVETARGDDLLVCSGHHPNAPVRKVAVAKHDGRIAVLAGDVVNHDELDWAAVTASLASGEARADCLRKLRGSFALLVVDRALGRMWVVTDPSAWLPVLLYAGDTGAIVSTSLAAVIRSMPDPVVVNDDWIYETMYFNHGTGPTTPVIGAKRLPPATVTEIDLRTWHVSQRTYRELPSRPASLVNGAAGIEEAIAQFRSTVPRYFPDDAPVSIGLSEGLDCRTVLAALPDERVRELHSFTFGMSISSEISEAQDIARFLGLTHTPVHLDREFLGQLPALARDTVFLSDGLQSINRSHLIYTYGRLQHAGEPYPVIMTGVSGDHIFRDHIQGWGNVPHIMSADAASQHRNGRTAVDASFYTRIFGDRFGAFEEKVERSLDYVEAEFGEFQDPQAYLSYLMFEAGPRYFGGQAAIANSFATFRTPFWDPDIIELGYRLGDATLGFSASLPKKDSFRETRVQAAIIAAHPTVGQLPYKSLPIGVYARGNKAVFQGYRLVRKLSSLLHRRRFIYSEDWQLWYRTVMNDELRRLLGDDSRVRQYVTAEFVEQAIADADVHWLGKLVTTEHTLRLIENGWERTD